MSQGPRRDREVLRPALERLEARLLLDAAWGAGSEGLLEYDPAWMASPVELSQPPAGGSSDSSDGEEFSGVLDVYVEDGLLASIQGSIDLYVADLTAEGYTVSVQEWSGSAEALRAQLQGRYATAEIEGALFVGDLPTLTYTNANDFDGHTVSFVHDLYFMDLDGTYVLNETEPDEHLDGTGDILPEIYVSRITTSTVAGLTGLSEVELIERYFAKAHAYRVGALTFENRGILWADDDWDHYTAYHMGGDALYDEILTVTDPAETTLGSYVGCLGLDFESMMFMAHSGVTTHLIHGLGAGNLTSAAVRDLNVRQGFYNLWNCSAGRFTWPDNLICTYVYSGDYGLSAVGTTKTGAMLASRYFYEHQGQGASVGQAFELWWTDAGISTDVLKRWHYGMTMQGDPTLRPATMGDVRLRVDAGDDQQLSPGRQVVLDGSGTYQAESGEPSWLWEQVSGPEVSLDAADEQVASFLPTETGTYVFRLTAQLGEIVSSDETTVFVVDPAPTGVDLLADSDTGTAVDDDVTRLNNGGLETRLQFRVDGTIPGAVVTVYADGGPIGAAIAAGEQTIVLTDGVHPLADGLYTITARQTEPGRPESADCSPLAVTIDTRGPGVALAETPDPRHVQVTFDEPVRGAGDAGDYELDYGASVTLAMADPEGEAVTLMLAGPISEILAYTLTVRDVQDVAGNPIADGATVSVAPAEPPLVLWWPFDETTGPMATDASGHGHHGQVIGATWQPGQGRVGGALWFHGDTACDYVIDVDAEEYLDGLDALTVALWIQSEETESDRGFLTTCDPPEKDCLNLRYDAVGSNGEAENTMKAYVQTDEDLHRCEGEAGLQTTDWQHVVMTWTSGDRIRLYADGAPQSLSHDEGPLEGLTCDTEELLIGTGYKETDGAWWGAIDDVRIYDRALSAAEVAALANFEPVSPATAAYEVDQDGVLLVDAFEGVLAGDVDPDGGPEALSAWQVLAPEHGLLTLDANGAFEYVPDAGYAGADTFIYRAFDGVEFGNSCTVTVTVRDTTPPVAEAWYSSADHGHGVGPGLLEIATDGTFCEPRAGGVHRLIVRFSEAIDPTSFSPSSVAVTGTDAAGGPVDVSLIEVVTYTVEAGTAGVIEFAPALPDAGRYHVSVECVRDPAGNVQTLAVGRDLAALAGDANGDLLVDAVDLSTIWPRRTGWIDPALTEEIRADVNADGRVDCQDLLASWSQRGGDLRDVWPSAPADSGEAGSMSVSLPPVATIDAVLPDAATAGPARASMPGSTAPPALAEPDREDRRQDMSASKATVTIVEDAGPDEAPSGRDAAFCWAPGRVDALLLAELLRDRFSAAPAGQ